MGQEFIIKSQKLEDKINQLLPSQGGFQAGVDLSASTTVIPIVDLTESAEGSGLREDLQRSDSIKNTDIAVNNASTTVLNTTGYFHFRGIATCYDNVSSELCTIDITDGATVKSLFSMRGDGTTSQRNNHFDFNVFVQAGESIIVGASTATSFVDGTFRQIADISGNLVDP
jgi:hypothetical protein